GGCSNLPRFVFQAEDGIRDFHVTGVQTCALPIWIVQVEPRPDRTCFEMTATRLDHQGRPYWAEDDLGGRFIACRAGYYDPAVFQIGRASCRGRGEISVVHVL